MSTDLYLPLSSLQQDQNQALPEFNLFPINISKSNLPKQH